MPTWLEEARDFRILVQALHDRNVHLDTLWTAGLLCAVCEERPWTQQAQHCTALVCAACAEGEPTPEED